MSKHTIKKIKYPWVNKSNTIIISNYNDPSLHLPRELEIIIEYRQ